MITGLAGAASVAPEIEIKAMSPRASESSPPAAQDQGEALALLKRHHRFPGPYMFKAIGPGHPSFEARVRGAVEKVLGPMLDTDRVRVRPSSGGKYSAVTLEVEVASAEQVLAVYDTLRALEGLVALV